MNFLRFVAQNNKDFVIFSVVWMLQRREGMPANAMLDSLRYRNGCYESRGKCAFSRLSPTLKISKVHVLTFISKRKCTLFLSCKSMKSPGNNTCCTWATMIQNEQCNSEFGIRWASTGFNWRLTVIPLKKRYM